MRWSSVATPPSSTTQRSSASFCSTAAYGLDATFACAIPIRARYPGCVACPDGRRRSAPEGPRRLHARSGRDVRDDVLDAGDPARALAGLRCQPVARGADDLVRRAGGRSRGIRVGAGLRPDRPSSLDPAREPAARAAHDRRCARAELRGAARLPDAAGVVHAGPADRRCAIRRRGVRAPDRCPRDGVLRLRARRRRADRPPRGRARERRRRLARGDRGARRCSPSPRRSRCGAACPSRTCRTAAAASPPSPQPPPDRRLDLRRSALLHVRRHLHLRHLPPRGAPVLVLRRRLQPHLPPLADRPFRAADGPARRAGRLAARCARHRSALRLSACS